MSKSAKKHQEETGHKVTYNGRFDSYYCKVCDMWISNACADINCWYCAERPLLPSLVQKTN